MRYTVKTKWHAKPFENGDDAAEYAREWMRVNPKGHASKIIIFDHERDECYWVGKAGCYRNKDLSICGVWCNPSQRVLDEPCVTCGKDLEIPG